MTTYSREYRGAPLGMGRSYVTWKNVDISSASAQADLDISGNDVFFPPFFTVSLGVKVLDGGDFAGGVIRITNSWYNELTDTLLEASTTSEINIVGSPYVDGIRSWTAELKTSQFNNVRPRVQTVTNADPVTADIHMVISPGPISPGFF